MNDLFIAEGTIMTDEEMIPLQSLRTSDFMEITYRNVEKTLFTGAKIAQR